MNTKPLQTVVEFENSSSKLSLSKDALNDENEFNIQESIEIQRIDDKCHKNLKMLEEIPKKSNRYEFPSNVERFKKRQELKNYLNEEPCGLMEYNQYDRPELIYKEKEVLQTSRQQDIFAKLYNDAKKPKKSKGISRKEFLEKQEIEECRFKPQINNHNISHILNLRNGNIQVHIK